MTTDKQNSENSSNSLSSKIQTIYKYIKKDDLNAFIEFIQDNPSFIYFRNRNKENILYYAFNKGSTKVAAHLLDNYPSLFLEKNIHNRNILGTIIFNNDYEAFNSLNSLFSEFKNQDILKQACEQENVSTLWMGVEYLSKTNWSIFENLCSSFWAAEEYLKIEPETGVNLAHHIAHYNAEHSKNVLKHIPDSYFDQAELITGCTPFLLACYGANLSLVENIALKSNLSSFSFLNSNLIHLGAYNKDDNVLAYLLENHSIYSTLSNSLEQTPLYCALSDNHEKNAIALLPYYTSIDISDELLLAAKNMSKFAEFWNTIFEQNNINEENIKNLKNNKNNIALFFSNLFYYADQNFIEKLTQSKLWPLIKEISHESFFMHQVYTSSIMNRKSMSYKIDCLLKVGEFMHVNQSEQFYCINNQGKDLTFTSNHDIFQKTHRSFCLIASISTLPTSQINEILQNSCLLEHLDAQDALFLMSIGIKRHSQSIINFVEKKADKNHITSKSHLDYALQDTLAQYYPNEKYNQYFQNILQKFNGVPNHLIKHLALNVSEKPKASMFFSHILQIFNQYPLYKKQIVVGLVESLIQVKNPHSALIDIFKEKKHIVENIFFEVAQKEPDSIKQNKLIDNIIHFCQPSKNYGAVIAHLGGSTNFEKHDLIKKLLPNWKINNKEDYCIARDAIKNNIIDDESWKLILNHAYSTSFFQDFLHLYFNQQVEHVSKSNLKTLSIAWKLLKSDEELLQEQTKNWFAKVIKTQNLIEHKDIITFFENILMLTNKSANIIKISLENNQPLYVQDKLNLNNEKQFFQHDFWNLNLNQPYSINLTHSHKPLDDYLKVVSQHKFSLIGYDTLMNQFFEWFENCECISSYTKFLTSLKFVDALGENISMVHNEQLLKICSNITKVFIDIPDTQRIDKKYFESFYDIILVNKKEDFFKLLLTHKDFDLINNNLTKDQQKRVHYYKLSEMLDSKKDEPLLVKKKNKI